MVLVGVAIILGSNKDRRVFFVNDFKESIQNTISSNTDNTYSFEIVKVKGEIDDTIIITPCKSCSPMKLSGKINEKFKSEFTQGNSIMNFNPYKATKGHLKITHKIR